MPTRTARAAVALAAVLALVLLGWGRSTTAGAETTEFQISDPGITDVAGMAAADGEDWYWTLDRGASPQVYAVSPQGDTVGVVDFRAEVSELEAVATSPEGLWVADVGDDQEQREQIAVYRLLDPQPGVTSLYNAWDLGYEDGRPRDAEAILVTGDRGLLVLTQGPDPAIWAPSEELSPDGLNTLEEVAPAPAGVSDATVLDDGRLALRTADAVSVLDPDTFAEVARTDVPEQTDPAALTQTLDGDGLLLTGGGPAPTVLRVGVPQGLPGAPSPSASGPGGGSTGAPPTDGEQGGETDQTAPVGAEPLSWLTAWPILVGVGAVLVLAALLVWRRRRAGTPADRSRRTPRRDPSDRGPTTAGGPGSSPSAAPGPGADPDRPEDGPGGAAPPTEGVPRPEPALAAVGAPVGGAPPHPAGHPQTPARAVPTGGAADRGRAPSVGSPRRALQVSEPVPAELTPTEAPAPAHGAPAPTEPAPTEPVPTEQAPAAAPPVPSAVVAEDVHVEYKVYASGKAVGSNGGRTLLSRTRGMRTVHALKGVSFTAHQGESIGVLGSNGSGKSTLMRVITGLTTPSAGAVYAAARPNMLGVGAALISGLSGERNIVLGGLALGLSKREIAELRDEIVDFAELEEFIELPMRTYSSGMQQRLKFAIAAAKQHEILIVDEALAVGDRRFRDRSEERIRQIRDSAGTIFLVSHSMKSIRDTCNRALWLDKGRLMEDGDPGQVIQAYEKHKRP